MIDERSIGFYAYKMADAYYEAIYDLIFWKSQSQIICQDINVTFIYTDGEGNRAVDLETAEMLIKRYRKTIVRVIIHLHQDYEFQLYPEYDNEKHRQKVVKDFLEGKDKEINVEVWDTGGLTNTYYNWRRWSIPKWFKLSCYMPIRIRIKGKKGVPSRYMVSDELFPFSETLEEFKMRVGTVSREMDLFVPSVEPEVVEVEETSTDGNIIVSGDLYQIDGDLYQDFSETGEDWMCASCDALNSDDDRRCHHCNSPRK